MEDMTNSLPTINTNPPEPIKADSTNLEQFEVIFKQFFPQWPAFITPFDDVFRMIWYLEETNVNPDILPRVIRGIHNITLGTGEGEVIIHVGRGVVTMETREREGEVQIRNI